MNRIPELSGTSAHEDGSKEGAIGQPGDSQAEELGRRSERSGSVAKENGLLRPTESGPSLYGSICGRSGVAALKQGKASIRVGDLAELISDKFDPNKLPDKEFDYIEIADIDERLGLLWSKRIPLVVAPERARKRVRFGDVLMSTVRRQRARVGVVPRELHGAICTTAFAVLRPNTNVNPYFLAFLLQTRTVIAQLEKLFIGTAYAAFHEKKIPALRLPTDLVIDRELVLLADRYAKQAQAFGSAYRDFSKALNRRKSASGRCR